MTESNPFRAILEGMAKAKLRGIVEAVIVLGLGAFAAVALVVWAIRPQGWNAFALAIGAVLAILLVLGYLLNRLITNPLATLTGAEQLQFQRELLKYHQKSQQQLPLVTIREEITPPPEISRLPVKTTADAEDEETTS